jgi:hypothetical protein
MLVNLPDAVVYDCNAGFDDPHAKELSIGFSTKKMLSQFPWLSQEPGWAEHMCESLGGSSTCDTLRFGKHPAGSIQGEEICVAGHTYRGKYRTYRFDWENPGVKFDLENPGKNSNASPQLSCGLYYRGVPIDEPTAPIPFSTDTEALAVWDRLVNSVRLRPVE